MTSARQTPTPPRARPTRAQLLAELAAARAAGDRERISQLLGRLLLAQPDRTKA